MKRFVSYAVIVALCAATAACGFKLRGQQTFPFETINVPAATPLGVELKRNIAAASAQTKLVDSPTDAEAVLTVLSENQEKVILSLNTQGRVREYQLRYRVVFRVSSQKGLDFGDAHRPRPGQTVSVYRPDRSTVPGVSPVARPSW